MSSAESVESRHGALCVPGRGSMDGAAWWREVCGGEYREDAQGTWISVGERDVVVDLSGLLDHEDGCDVCGAPVLRSDAGSLRLMAGSVVCCPLGAAGAPFDPAARRVWCGACASKT